MPGIFKRLLSTTLLSLLIIPCARSAIAASDTTPATVLVRIGEYEITRGDLDNAASKLLRRETFHGAVSNERLREIRDKALEHLIENQLIYDFNKKKKLVSVKRDEVRKAVRRLKKRFPDFKERLKENAMTMKDLEKGIIRSMTIRKVKDMQRNAFKKRAERIVTDAFMKKYYKEHIDKFKVSEQVHMRGILIKADPAGGRRALNAALKKIRPILKRARDGEDFASLAREFSEVNDPSNGGDMGWRHREALVEEISSATKDMKAGEISDPIRILEGMVIVKIEGTRPPRLKSYDELNHEKLRNELRKRELKRITAEWKAEIRKGAKIERLAEAN